MLQPHLLPSPGRSARRRHPHDHQAPPRTAIRVLRTSQSIRWTCNWCSWVPPAPCPPWIGVLPRMLLIRGGERILIDCGEGTQRQLMRSAGLARIGMILITHLHGDHYLGLPGLLKTLSLQGREEPLLLFGPEGLYELLRDAERLVGRPRFPVPRGGGSAGHRPGDLRLLAQSRAHRPRSARTGLVPGGEATGGAVPSRVGDSAGDHSRTRFRPAAARGDRDGGRGSGSPARTRSWRRRGRDARWWSPATPGPLRR